MDIHPGWWALAVFSNVYINVGVMMFFYYRRLEQLEGYLDGVACVESNRASCGGGLYGRQRRLNTIARIVMTPGLVYKRGKMPKDADKRIPAKLRKQLMAAYAHLFFTALSMVLWYFVLPDRTVT